MTRLEATSEPSMEDILASIRKIIAEDPPGSRAAPAPSRAAGQPLQSDHQPAMRATEHDSFFTRSSARSDAPLSPVAPAGEPYLRSMPDKGSPAPFASEPFFSSTPGSASPSVPSSRIEPSFGAVAPAEISADPAPFSAVSELSVDAQLSDLLGDVLPERAGASDGAEPLHQASESAATPSKPSETRPGFTVSRDGYVANGTERARTGDAFEFDLGPSPFQTKPAGMGPAVNSMTARMSASALQRIAPLSSDMTAPNQPVDTAAQSPAGEVSESSPDKATEPAAGIAPSTAAEAAASDEPARNISDAAAPSVGFAAPSVAATIAPPSATAPAAPEPVARFIPANASVETPKQIDRDVLEVMAPQRISAGTDAMEVMRVSAEADPALAQSTMTAGTSLSISSIDGHERSMEDTVAELLRPMLKTWLAENMPRIVERALRRELTEQLLGDKQAAAE